MKRRMSAEEKRRLNSKATDDRIFRHFPAPLPPSTQKTKAKMSAPSAMCTVETVNGREYKVRDMAQADFGE